MKIRLTPVLCIIIALIIMQASSAVDFSTVIKNTCNSQTTLDFRFSSDSTVTTASNTPTSASSSYLKFLDANGNDLVLSLDKFQVDTTTASSFVTGYSTTGGVTIAGAFLFKFISGGGNNVYVFIPFTTSTTNDNINFLNNVGKPIGSFVVSGTPVPLTAFNSVGETNYNVWFSANRGTNTILASNFIYQVPAQTATTGNALITQLNALIFSGQTRLCYASNLNFQTHLRESYPLWFVWVSFFIFWLFYLFAESTTLNINHKKFQNNNWTCWSIYSLAFLAHQQYFTRLSRLTVLYINVILQGLIAGCIMGNVQSGPAMIIWVAVVVFVATIPFPFIFGEVFFKKIYETSIQKYYNIKSMIGVLNRKQLQPNERAVEEAEQKIFSLYHWFYSIFFIIFFVCIPITINQMQRLSRVNYHYHYYWIASVFLAFIFQHFLLGPLWILLSNSQLIRNRGGYFYNIKMAESYREAQIG